MLPSGKKKKKKEEEEKKQTTKKTPPHSKPQMIIHQYQDQRLPNQDHTSVTLGLHKDRLKDGFCPEALKKLMVKSETQTYFDPCS